MAPQELRETKWAAILLLKDDQKTRGVIVIHMYILTLLLLSCYRSEKEGGAFQDWLTGISIILYSFLFFRTEFIYFLGLLRDTWVNRRIWKQ
jgi:hypothetical protein